MCLNYFFNSFHNALSGTQIRFLSTSFWVGLILCFEFAFSQIENNNSSFSFPPNDGDNFLYQPPAEDSPFLRGDFLKKPLDMTDPANTNVLGGQERLELEIGLQRMTS